MVDDDGDALHCNYIHAVDMFAVGVRPDTAVVGAIISVVIHRES